MKNLFLIFLTLLALQACTSEFDKMLNGAGRAGRVGDGAVFYATIEDTGAADPQTKVYADEQLRVLWNADDMISIFDKKTANLKYQFSGADGDNAGTFTKVSEGVASGSILPYVYAIYPYQEATSISGDGEISFVLPAVQQYKANSFGPEANTMVSVSEDNNLLFKNAGGYLSLKLYGSDIKVKSIKLRGNNDEKLAGAALISMPYGSTPTVTMQESATEYVTLTCETPVSLGPTADEYTEFWFVLPPTNFAKGFTISVFDDQGGLFEKSTSKFVTISRNTLSYMAPVEVVPNVPIPLDNEIWYIADNDKVVDILSETDCFNCTVISNEYSGGMGRIVCDGPIEKVYKLFPSPENVRITNIYLPNSITSIESWAFSGISIEQLRLPDNLENVGTGALHCEYLRRFTGKHASDDGRCVILDGFIEEEDGISFTLTQYDLVAFAPYGLSEYSLPANIEKIEPYVFGDCHELKAIYFNEGLKCIMADVFSGDNLDCDIIFPSSLEQLDNAFRDCNGIKGFYGNEDFCSPDHLCALSIEKHAFTPSQWHGKWINKFVGVQNTTYTIPEGIRGIGGYAFKNMQNLRSVTFPSTIVRIDSNAFDLCDNLEAVYGDCTSDDHKAIVIGDTFNRLVISKGIKKYVVPEGIKQVGYQAFCGLTDLEEIIIPDSVTELGGYDFAWCPNLKKVVLSSKLRSVGELGTNPFLGSPQLESILFRSLIPPRYTDTQFDAGDCTHLTVYVPEQSLYLYKQSGWSKYAPYMLGYNYDDIGDWYLSTDFSKDGDITTLQQSSSNSGIDLVLMGDGFSDRQIADGTYDNVMRKAVDAFFSEEPYKSFKNLFNISYVNIVSMTEGYEYTGQTLETWFGDGAYVYGNNQKVIEYAQKIVPDSRMDDALVIVMMNRDYFAGTCFMYYPDSGDYGRGLSIAYFPTCSDTDSFNGLVSHEAGGHGFAKLADEYAYENMGAVPQDVLVDAHMREAWGWNKNVDFTNDPTQVKWAQFISDARYANEGIGVYEGAYTYWTGAWRPTENSIMRYNTGGFNAPSRYAIWYRIGKLAYGEDWNGSYEDFVTYDAVNRMSSGAANPKTKSRNYVEKQLPPLAPPVVVGHSWREELK